MATHSLLSSLEPAGVSYTPKYKTMSSLDCIAIVVCILGENVCVNHPFAYIGVIDTIGDEEQHGRDPASKAKDNPQNGHYCPPFSGKELHQIEGKTVVVVHHCTH